MTLPSLVCAMNGFMNRSALSMFSDDVKDRVGNMEEMYMVDATVRSNFTESRPLWSSPFIFFHQRKAGGSSIRDTLKRAADTNQYDPFVPCYGHSCDIYQLPTHKPYGLYAGHFPWGSQYVFDRLGGTHNRDKFSCLTNFREPVSRLISCVEFRFPAHVKKHGCMSNLPKDRLIEILSTKTDEYGSSCLSEPFRIMSGFADEDVLNGLGIEVNAKNMSDNFSSAGTHYEIYPKFTDVEALVLKLTLNNVAKCGVVILEEPRKETNLLLSRRFPDLYSAGAFRPVNLNKEHAFEKCPALKPEQIEILEKFGAFERLLYDIVVKQQRNMVARLLEI